MSELSTAPADPQKAVEDPRHVIEEVRQPPVFITAQTVAFSTAAAMPLRRNRPTSWLLAGLRATFVRSSEDARQTPRHYPPRRAAFLEEAGMEREMHRL